MLPDYHSKLTQISRDNLIKPIDTVIKKRIRQPGKQPQNQKQEVHLLMPAPNGRLDTNLHSGKKSFSIGLILDTTENDENIVRPVNNQLTDRETHIFASTRTSHGLPEVKMIVSFLSKKLFSQPSSYRFVIQFQTKVCQQDIPEK